MQALAFLVKTEEEDEVLALTSSSNSRIFRGTLQDKGCLKHICTDYGLQNKKDTELS